MHANAFRWTWMFPLLVASSALAAPTLRHSADQRGNVVLFGNTLARDCGVSGGLVVGSVGSCGFLFISDTGADAVWRSDHPEAGQARADSSIHFADARSTAVLDLPPGAQVTYARLYWSAHVATEGADTEVVIGRPGVFSADVVADDWALASRSSSEHYYQSTADITELVQAHGPGAFQVSGVDMRNPSNLRSEVHYAAWSVVVFYALESEVPRNLTIFDGLELVTQGISSRGTVEGFLVPNSGFDGRLGVIAYEGDASISGDSLSFNDTLLSNELGETDNFFNSSRTHFGNPISIEGDLPQATGAAASMSGLDLDVVSIEPYLSPGDTSATFEATSTQDTYLIGAFVTSVATLKPLFTETSKSVLDLNGGSVAPGDELLYTVTTVNTGTDHSAGTVLTDPLPVGVTFVPGSLRVIEGLNAGPLSDGPGDDQAEYDPATHTITFRLGNGADAQTGGALAPGEQASVEFRVTVDVDAWGEIANQAWVTAAGAVGQGQGVPPVSFPSDPAGTGERRPTVVDVAHDTVILEGPPALSPSARAFFRFGTSLPDASYECELDGAAWTACAAESTFEVSEGPHVLAVRYVDGDGATDPTPAVHAWSVDLTPPDTFLVSSPDPVITVPGASVAFDSDDPEARFECSLNGAPWEGCVSPWHDVTDDGPQTFQVRAVDAAGNVDPTPATATWTVDTTPPDTFLVSSPDPVITVPGASVAFESDDPEALFECSLNGAPWEACVSPWHGVTDEGPQTFQVRAVDAAGNVDPTPATATWTVDTTSPEARLFTGGGGCSSTGGASAPWMALIALLVLSSRSHRRMRASAGMGAVLALVLALPMTAGAQEATGAIDVQLFKAAPGATSLLNVHDAEVLAPFAWSGGLWLTYADDPLVAVDPATGRKVARLVESQASAELAVAMGVLDRIELGLTVPVSFQARDASQPGVSGSVLGFGDLRLVPRVMLFEPLSNLKIAAALPVVIPTGGAGIYGGSSGLGVQPRLIFSYGQVTRARVVANVGVNLRSRQQLGNVVVGNEFAWSLAGAIPFEVADVGLSATATVYGVSGLHPDGTESSPVEALLGLQARLAPEWTVSLSAGRGMVRGYGSTDGRVVAGVTLTPQRSGN